MSWMTKWLKLEMRHSRQLTQEELLLLLSLEKLCQQPQLEIAYLPQTPHGSPTTRPPGDDDGDVDIDEHQAKRLKNEDSKRVRLQRITAEHAAHVNAVQFGDDTVYTMDSYEKYKYLEQPSDPFDFWTD